MRFWIGFGLRIFFGAWVGLGWVGLSLVCLYVCVRVIGAVRCGAVLHTHSLTHSLVRDRWMGR